MLSAIGASVLASLRTLAIPVPLPPAEPALVAPHPITVRIIDTAAEFGAMQYEWEALHEEAAAASVFNSWLWQYRWWELYGADQPLRLLVAVQAGAIVGILPLYIRVASAAKARVRELRAIGTGSDTHPDDLGPVISCDASEAAVMKALCESALRMPGWDVLLLTDQLMPSPFPGLLAQIARCAGIATLTGASEKIRYIALPSEWRAFLASLKRERRARLQNARRKLLASHSARFFIWTDPVNLDRAVDKLVELHRKRWGLSSDSFATPEYVEVHRRIMKACLERGWLRLYCLEVDGEIAAMSYCYRFRNRVFLMQSGYDPALSRFKPGNVLLGYALEDAVAQGHEVFDFLRGEHRYKQELSTGNRETAYVAAFRPTVAGWLYRLRKFRLPRLKSKLFSSKLKPPR
jgi:CelD/BcsL family acetyltransferase involved in cellulose biosynthesis